MRLHKRTRLCEKAKIEYDLWVYDFQCRHKLTETEVARIILSELQQRTTLWLRSERHPDSDKRADEE